jgi:hypothetical protein
MHSTKPRKYSRSFNRCTKVLWTYETTTEQTGAASKYWDMDAPSERATKKAANEKLLAIKACNDPNEGYFFHQFVFMFIRKLGHSHFLR